MKMSKKKLLAITLTLTTFLAMFAILRPTTATEYINVNDYCWIEGVLHDDTYALYPYAEESIDIGFSKYGEMIGYNEATGIGLGIQYPGYESAATVDAPDGTYDQREDSSVDPFCNEYMGVDWWMNGWFIDIKYRTPAGVYREIWAMAIFSDGEQHGGDWITMPSVESTSLARPLWQEYAPFANPDSNMYAGIVTPIPAKGGRKTNGACETEPIQIIYNGPRRFVALCKTTISDVGGGADLIALYFTFIFNKAEKNVIVLKDVKRLYAKQPMNIQFGNRGEWDLGIAGATDSYTHWYTDEPVQYWDMDESGGIDATEVATSFEFFKDYMLIYKHPKKWWDDPPVYERPATVYNEFSQVTEAFPETWLETQETCYGREWHMDETIKEHSYAVAQVISKAGDYVGALAVWPHPEFWSAANTFFPPAGTIAPAGNNPSNIPLMLAPISRMLNWHKWTVAEDPNQGAELLDLIDRDDIWVKNDDIRMPDGSTLEPVIPFIIYEHDFKLSSTLQEYRIVSVYTLTDYHDADDADADDPGNVETWSSGLNIIDREIQYQLDEIFDPWDIYDAMHKNYKRWVQFYDHGLDVDGVEGVWDGETYYCVQLDSYREVESGDLIPTLPVVRVTDNWDAYSEFSERLLVDTGSGFVLIYPSGYQNIDPIPGFRRPYYVINRVTGLICFWEWDYDLWTYVRWYLPVGSRVKVLWSSEHHATTAGQWDGEDLLYPIDGDTFRFPLHHDIMDKYKNDTEVLLIEEGPVRLLPGAREGPYYVALGDTITVYGVPICSEVDVKYYTTTDTTTWIEEKFHVGRMPMDLAFVIDITGSMIDELSDFQAAVSGILDAAEAWSGGDVRYSLVTFSDTVTVDQDWTTIRSTIETAIAGLTASGGAGCPEASDEALNTVVNELSARTGQTGDFSAWRERVHKRLVIFTDAPPGGFDDTYQASDLANAKTHANTAATKGIVISSIEGDTTCDGPVTTEALQYYTSVTGGVYLKLNGIDIADAVEAAFEGFTFTLSYPPHYIEKVWYHSEKALLGGDYVFNNATKTLYMQDPVPAGEWLAAWYTVDRVVYINFFEGDGERTVFVLQAYPDVGSLFVWNNDILQQIVEEGSEEIPPQVAYIAVPKGDCYWRSTDYGTYEAATWLVFSGLEEREWLALTDIKVRGNWIIHETSTCDELILDQAPLCGQELKIVFKVPSGRWEWGIVGEPSAAVDSIGAVMTVAAFKNKLMEFGLGGLDVQDSTFGPRLPWMRSHVDTDNRQHLFDDWCSYYETVPDDSWPISSSNIITVGGPYPNMVSKYFNEFAQALMFTTIGDGFYAVTCWDNDLSGRGSISAPSGFYDGGLVTDRFGYAVISTYKDKNGTIGFMLYGWTGQDTYYAAKWFDEHKFELQHINLHVTDLILRITYKSAAGTLYCPPTVSIVEKLGTISEKPQHDC